MSADFAVRRAYLSDPFPATEERSDLETWFARALASQGVRAPFVQCPRPAARDLVIADRAHAEKFLRDLGFAIVRVHPGSG